jgi:hypothetical protein
MFLKGSIFLLGVALLSGCAHTQNLAVVKPPGPMSEELAQRNNAASLLYDLLNDEKNVNKLLIIKRNSKELGHLIDAVASSSGDAQKQLDNLAKADPQLNFHALELPAGEKATRAAIAKTEEHELLFSSGENFQFQLLLTQADALSYGSHLAGICAQDSSRPEEVRAFTGIRLAMEDLYRQVVTMMKTEAPATAH